ncbi:hypothetical protein [Pseudorhodoferax sp. Leaf267]|uniref:hypothetical protein n=1 Tax=Pseudorhodoferax sp. Leaf267 TaxID=1736316 RepID=UPI0006FA3EA5|nr:hypothetical protein [Pseudorhodoferax sp. Leaf267]KQP13228.1 hypothetical protein ASF43_19215 [Pseudorhodoferax sp. Leaf267]
MQRRSFTASASAIAACAAGLPAAQAAQAQDAREHRATLADIQRWVAGRHKRVLTFLGYSGAEYQDHAAMLAQAAAVLAENDPARTLVNIGATPDGIGSVYALARQLGFETMGIVSTKALEGGGHWSPAVDHVFLVQDSTWGGADANGTLGPTSAAMVAVSDEMVAIGGGAIARDEALAGRRAGKRMRFFPADANHGLARQKALRAGQPVPTTFASALGTVALSAP